jgi:DnaA family protein
LQDENLSHPIPQQLSLGVTLSDDTRFENFYVAADGHNTEVVAALRAQVQAQHQPFIYLWGPSGSGLSHLLQAGCHYAQQCGLAIQYLPLLELARYTPDELFAELESLDYLALDDLQAVAGKPDWELALFRLYNILREKNKRLLIASQINSRELPLHLEDLRSRLQWGLTYHLEPLSDDEKRHALQARARARGLELGDELAHYLLQRLPRDTHELFRQLHHLDCASLAEQRKLTIPFVKKILNL